MLRMTIFAGLLLFPVSAAAGDADVVDVKATPTGETWRFDVKVEHADEGWDHYADAWRVTDDSGIVYGTRTLHHPHVNEQPFTRSLSGIEIPPDVLSVTVESHDSVHGWGGRQVVVALPR